MSHSISVTCPGCRVQGPVPAEMQGSAIACRRCGTRFPVAAPAPERLGRVDEFLLPSAAAPVPTMLVGEGSRPAAPALVGGAPTVRRPARERTVLDQYFRVCAWGSTALAVLVLLTGLQLPVSPRRIFHFAFALGIGIFSAGCTFAPEHVLGHPRIMAAIGTKNPVVARAVCAVAAVVMAIFCCAVVFAPDQH